VDRIFHILARRTRNSVLLIGEPGVGKTALIEGLAARLASGSAHPTFANRRLVSIDAAWLRWIDWSEPGTAPVARYRARRLEGHGGALLAIEGLLDRGSVASLHFLEPSLTSRELQCIATGSPAGFRRFARRFAGLARRFELVELAEPTPDEAVAILQAHAERYAKYHGVSIGEAAIPAAVFASGRFLPHRRLPDRAFDLLDEACARVKLAAQATGKAEVAAEDIAAAAAERCGVPVEAVERALALHKPFEVQAAAREIVSRLPPDQHSWAPLLTAWLAACSPAEAEALAQAIREIKAGP